MMQRQNQAINIATLNVNTLETACDDYQLYLKDLEVGSKVTKLEKFELEKELSNWDDNVTDTFGWIMGAHDYIIPINQPAGRKFDKDNSKLFSMLTLATLDTLVKLTLCGLM